MHKPTVTDEILEQPLDRDNWSWTAQGYWLVNSPHSPVLEAEELLRWFWANHPELIPALAVDKLHDLTSAVKSSVVPRGALVEELDEFATAFVVAARKLKSLLGGDETPLPDLTPAEEQLLESWPLGEDEAETSTDPKEMAEATGKSVGAVRKLMASLAKKGLVDKLDANDYRLTPMGQEAAFRL